MQKSYTNYYNNNTTIMLKIKMWNYRQTIDNYTHATQVN